jgi:transcriptional regulator with XRE-family HTH domain
MAEVSESGRLLAEAIERYGLTQGQVGNMLGVSDRMVRRVLSGERPGNNLADAARQLATRGAVTAQPVRRAQRVVTGTREGGKRQVSRAAVQPGSAGEAVDYHVESGGRSQTRVEGPGRGLGRERARDAILRDMRAHKSGGARLYMSVITKDGRRIELGRKGGYDPARALAAIKAEGDDPFGWLSSQLVDVESGTSDPRGMAASNIAGLVLTYS